MFFAMVYKVADMFLLFFLVLYSLPIDGAPTNSSSQFRVAHGIAAQMVRDDLEHMVRVIGVFSLTRMDGSSIIDAKSGQQAMKFELCGGTKVTQDQLLGKKQLPKEDMAEYILTAGHCVPRYPEFNRDAGAVMNLQHVFVVSGTDRVDLPVMVWQKSDGKMTPFFFFDKSLESNNHVHTISWIASRYNSRWLFDNSDLAIMKLHSKVKTQIKKLDLEEVPPDGKPDECRVAGWGQNEHGVTQNSLRQSRKDGTELLTQTQCHGMKADRREKLPVNAVCKWYAAGWETYSQPMTLCTFHPRGSVGCQGDSGGPLMCRHWRKDGTLGEETIRGVQFGTYPAVIERELPGWCLSPQNELRDCNEQKGDEFEMIQNHMKLSEVTIREWIQRCIKVLASPDSHIDQQKLDCYAAEYLKGQAKFERLNLA